MVTAPDRTTFDHMAACELAEKRAIAVYGAVFADGLARRMDPWDAHEFADRASRQVPRPPQFRVPTALERQQGAGQVNATAVKDWEARR